MNYKINFLFLVAFILACITFVEAATKCDACIKVCNIDPTDASNCIAGCRRTFNDCTAESTASFTPIALISSAILIAFNAVMINVL